MDQWFNEILLVAFTPALIVAGTAFIFKSVIKQMLDRDINSFKMNLQNELKYRFLEYDTKLSYLHRQQAEAITQFYALLAETELQVEALVNHEADDSRLAETQTAINDLVTFYRTNDLYFTDQMGGKMDEIISSLKVAYQKYSAAASENKNNQFYLRAHAEALKTMQINVPILKKQLSKIFRAQLYPVAPEV